MNPPRLTTAAPSSDASACGSTREPRDSRLGLSVIIASKNRPESLVRCLRALSLIDDLVVEVLVTDDAGTGQLLEAFHDVPPTLLARIRLTQQSSEGYIVARNRMVKAASSDYVLSLDDDAFLVESTGIRRGLEQLRADRSLAAVAFAQADADGTPWPAAMQPARVSYPCYAPAFIGFAALLHRQVFLDLGGFREQYIFYGEEKDYCLRALEAGYRILFLPDARVAHVIDPAGRHPSRYLRHVIRNDCLYALYNEPFPMMLATVPLRLQRYFTMRRAGAAPDKGGLGWILRDLAATLPETRRLRNPVRWTTIRKWRRLTRRPPAYRGLETA
jgi:GT2 family glycosyltransferase